MRVIVDATHACLDQHREPEFGVGHEQEWRAPVYHRKRGAGQSWFIIAGD
jgi:hypothetical protein